MAETQQTSEAATSAALGSALTWQQALPLVRALRDIAQASTDPTAAEVATTALHEAFPGPEMLNVLFGGLVS